MTVQVVVGGLNECIVSSALYRQLLIVPDIHRCRVVIGVAMNSLGSEDKGFGRQRSFHGLIIIEISLRLQLR